MALNYSFDLEKFKQDFQDAWKKIKTVVLAWYVTQTWLHALVPFRWYEELKKAEAQISLLSMQIESERQARVERAFVSDAELIERNALEKRHSSLEAHLNWVINNPSLNASAKAVAFWLLSELRPDTPRVDRSTVESAARKR